MDKSPTTSVSVPGTPTEKRLLWLVRDLVIQNCLEVAEGHVNWNRPLPVFSGFIGVHAEAIRFLSEYGLVVDFVDGAGGRDVRGSVLTMDATAKILNTYKIDLEDD